MSDIFLSAGLALAPEEVADQFRWATYTHTWNGQRESLNWIITRVDDPALWSPAWDASSQTRVLIAGRFAFDESEWQQAERLPCNGGLAASLILDRWLKRGKHAIEQLNGGGLAVIIDERARELHIWTDRLGFYPVFCWTGTGFIICSHADVAANVLEKAGHPCDFDALTMAEFLRTGTATQPHTYWRGIDQLDAGMYYRFTWGATPKLKEQHQFWRPAYFDQPFLEDRREIVERLTDALTTAVRRRTLPRLGKVALLLSAGADSRTALFAACDPSEVTCFTCYDEPNDELRGAKALAVAADATHIGYQRSAEYYIENAAQAVRVSGGMWTIESAHATGLLPAIGTPDFGTVLTGCYADYLLKGIAYNRTPKRIFGRNIPLYNFAPFDYQWHHAHIYLGTAWDTWIDGRLEKLFDEKSSRAIDRRAEIEFRRVVPIIREPDASGRLLLRRCTGLDVFLSDNGVVDLFGSISPTEKLNGIPFGMAASRICGKHSRQIFNNNYSAPVGASEFRRVAAFVRASVTRKLIGKGCVQPYEKSSSSIATTGSWPYFPQVIRISKMLRDWHSSQCPEQRDLLFDMLGDERRKWSLEDWASHAPTLFMRYYTASLWLGQQPQALSRIETARIGR